MVFITLLFVENKYISRTFAAKKSTEFKHIVFTIQHIEFLHFYLMRFNLLSGIINFLETKSKNKNVLSSRSQIAFVPSHTFCFQIILNIFSKNL